MSELPADVPETPENRIATGLATLALAIRIGAAVQDKRLTADVYDIDVTVVTGGAGMRLPAFSNATGVDLQNGVQNLILLALGGSALITAETLELVFGRVDDDMSSQRLGVRVMVSQLRHAFAHNPFRPRWVIKPQYRTVYPVTLQDGSGFSFDATNLNAQHIRPADVGGLEFWIRLLKHCEQLVAGKPAFVS
jgi:hypothetical protein